MTEFDIRAIRGDDLVGWREWNAVVDESPKPDIYYRPDYATLYQGAGERAIALLMSIAGNKRFLVPLIVRPVPGTASRFDAITPYGYGGVCVLATDLPQPGELSAMLDAIGRWGIRHDILCFVLRLHPLLRQSEWRKELEGDDRVHLMRVSTTIGVDVSRWDSDSDRPRGLSTMRRRNLTYARRELRSTMTGPSAGQEHVEHIRFFSEMYTEAMKRLDADSFLRFSLSYFTRLSQSLADKAALQLCWVGNEPVAGAIFFADACHAHYHLGAVTESGRNYSAGTLSIVEGARWAHERGCKWLHMGGGNSADDSLFQFKRSFGGETFTFLALTFVIDSEEFARVKSLPEAQWPYI